MKKMKKVKQMVEVEVDALEELDESGLESLLGKKVTLLCMNYFYTGVLTGVNEDSVCLTEASIVYETGAWDKATYSDVQKLPCKELFVRIPAIEAYGVLK